MLHTACSLLLLCTPPVEAPDSLVAIVDVTVIPMDRERTLPGARRAGVMLRGRWLPEAEIESKLAAIARSVGN